MLFNKVILKSCQLLIVISITFLGACSVKAPVASVNLKSSFYDYSLVDLQGNEIQLANYAGVPSLVINFALLCGTTEQVADVAKLAKDYVGRINIFVIINNSFGTMTAMDDHQISLACSSWSKVNFYQENLAVFDFLLNSNENYAGPLSFNFEKFLVSKDGQVAARFSSFVGITSQKFQSSLEEIL